MEGLWWVCRFNRFRCILNEKHITLFILSVCQTKIWYSPNDLYTFPWSFPSLFHTINSMGPRWFTRFIDKINDFFPLKIICRLWFEIRWFRVYFLRFLSITSNQITTIFRLTRISLLFFLRFFFFSSMRFNRLSSTIEQVVPVQQTMLWVTVSSWNFQHPR